MIMENNCRPESSNFMSKYLKHVNSRETIYVSHPESYDIKYEINQWMNLEYKIDKVRAIYQWNQYVKALKSTGATIYPLYAGAHPDTVFIADAGIIIDDSFLLSNFKYPERQSEQAHWLSIAEKLGYKIIKLPPEIIIEGTGDCKIVYFICIQIHNLNTIFYIFSRF